MFTSVTKPMIELLLLRKGSKRERKIVSQYQMAPLNLCKILKEFSSNSKPTDMGRFQVLFVSVTLIGQFASLYSHYECYIEIFTPFSNLLNALLSKALPPQIQELIESTLHQINEKIGSDLVSRTPLQYKELKPMPLRSLAPDIIEKYILFVFFNVLNSFSNFFLLSYVPGRDYDKNKERARLRALKKQVKSEKKGAMRELRKDSVFLENERMKKRLEEDKERKDKYKEIMHSLEVEQHHYNVSKKEGRKKK